MARAAIEGGAVKLDVAGASESVGAGVAVGVPCPCPPPPLIPAASECDCRSWRQLDRAAKRLSAWVVDVGERGAPKSVE
jgi:hypothetical protein